MKVLVDTNVLLRAIDRSQPLAAAARNSLKHLHAKGSELCLTPKNVREFWNVCTRPAEARSGLGHSVTAADRHLRMLERFFTILPDSPETYQAWRGLVVQYQVRGAKAHDTYLVAAMLTHQVTVLLTFDNSDFSRYDDIQILDPRILADRSPAADI